MIKPNRRTRDRIAYGILVPLMLIEVFRYQRDLLFQWRLPNKDEEILQYIARFDSIRVSLPQSGIVGYITDRFSERRMVERIPRLSGEEFRDWYIDPDTATAWKHYYLAQYALAPTVLHVGEGFPLVVGNFPDKEFESGEARSEGLQLVQDFEMGVSLFRRAR